MILAELAFACFIYSILTDYDSAYLLFLQATNNSPDLSIDEHRMALLRWLNNWGCRQFALDYHQQASEEIFSWHNEYSSNLFPVDRDLWELTETDLSLVSEAYESLSNRIASYRTTQRNSVPVSFGPTGAAKILFAIRPKAHVPWDGNIRDTLGYTDSGNSYIAFLNSVNSILDELTIACKRNGFHLSDLPRQLGRQNSTVPKLIDEFYWVTITKNYSLPDTETFQRWANWI